MGTILLDNLPSAWHVDQAIMSEDERLVVIRFGNMHVKKIEGGLEDEADVKRLRDIMRQDEILAKIAKPVSNFAVIYTCDLHEVPDFNGMYELWDGKSTIMFFFRNKHMMCDFGTGNNNKIDWVLEDKQELIDICEVIYKGAKKGRGLVVSPKDYSTRYRY